MFQEASKTCFQREAKRKNGMRRAIFRKERNNAKMKNMESFTVPYVTPYLTITTRQPPAKLANVLHSLRPRKVRQNRTFIGPFLDEVE